MTRTALLPLLLVPLLCRAGDPPAPTGKESSGKDQQPDNRSRWRYGASFSHMSGIDVRFSNLGGISNASPLPPTGGGVNHDYDDGFVHVDSSNNFDGRTWNWGYDNASQYDPANGGSVKFHHSSGWGDAADSENGESASGIQFSAVYDGGPLPVFGDKGVTWGARFSLNLLGGEVSSTGALPATLARLEDSYALNGVVPQASPWQDGSFNGPGPRISDTPVRSPNSVVIPGGSTVTGRRELELDIAAAEAGLFVSFPLTKKLSAGLETGLTLALASADYTFTSIASAPGLASQTSRGAADDSEWLPGFYLGGNLEYQINDKWSLLAGVRYQYMDDFSVRAGSSTAAVDLSSTVTTSVGFLFRF